MIRKHKPEDLEQILHVWEQSSRLAHPFLDEDFVKKVASDMRNLYVPDSETWVFEEQEIVVGFVSMMGNEIAGLFVLPAHHSKGIGTALLGFVAKEHKVLEVEVFEKNSIGRAFYDKSGFELLKQFNHEESRAAVLRLQRTT
jgi:putative acetyltransferase